MVKKIIILNKKEGQTPLEAVLLFKNKNPKYKDVPMTYAGRLDPMASGVLIILAGEEVKNKEKYLKLDKEYDFEVLFNFRTDTYDILGKVLSNISPKPGLGEIEGKIRKELKNFKGKVLQKYPMYSSKTVKGKPLWLSARAGEEVKIPEREVNIKSLKLIKIRKINNKKLFENIEKRINKVNGDFRQREIKEIWKKELMDKKVSGMFYIASFKIKCSSGTYVRTIADTLGKKLEIGAIAYSIKRTKVGKYMI